MRRRISRPPTQLPFDLKRETPVLPIDHDTTALLQALADLLLGALGEEIDAQTSPTQDQGGTDEPEDHA